MSKFNCTEVERVYWYLVLSSVCVILYMEKS